MKKTIFALFTVLLVLSLATCDLLEQPETAKSVVENGMVTLTINVDGVTTRALNATNSAPGGTDPANYYEVVFKNGSTYIQIAFSASSGNPAEREITVPIANYAAPGNDAVIFGGKYDGTDYTLLGVGAILSTTGGAGAGNNADITKDTTGVTFRVTALKNGVGGSNSTFKITEPTATVGAIDSGHDFATDTTHNSNGAIPTVTDSGPTYPGTYPVFPVPKAGYTNVGSTGSIVGEYSVTITNFNKVILSGPWSLDVAPISLGSYTGSSSSGTPGVQCTPTSLPTTTTPAPVTLSSATCTFTFGINVSDASVTDGLYAVSIDAPCYALSPTHKGGTTLTWHIRGGTVNANPDNGGNTGGAVVLAVGILANFDKQVTISNPGGSDWVDP